MWTAGCTFMAAARKKSKSGRRAAVLMILAEETIGNRSGHLEITELEA